MHQCEFCNVMFQPRPQVKHPRACRDCQKKRQQANEKAWHSKHKTGFDCKYHQNQKRIRMQSLREHVQKVTRWIEIGMTYVGQAVNLELLTDYLVKFFIDLGIRRANKLCIPG